MTESVPILRLEGITRRFGTGPGSTFALRSLSLTVLPGEFVAVVGPSGSGKSTLLNILGLLDTPTSGTHHLGGVDVGGLRERERNELRSRKIGFVFQDAHVLLDDSAAVNASLGLTIQGVPRRERSSRVRLALELLGLSHRAGEKAKNLSGGERQRVAIARAIATGPSLLLADEPTGALDSENTRKVVEHLHELNAGGVTVLVITHDERVAATASRVVRLLDGVLDDGLGGDTSFEAVRGEAVPGDPVQGEPVRARLPPPRKLLDEVLDAISSHSSRPGRTALLLAAFLLGTGGLVCSAGVSQTAATQVSDRLTQASLDEVTVRAADQAKALRNGFYDRDGPSGARRAIDQLEGVASVGFVATVATGDASVTLLPPGGFDAQPVFRGPVRVADSGYLAAQGATVAPASGASLLSNSWDGDVAVLGRAAAKRIGLSGARPGATIFVAGKPVDVVGVITGTGRDERLDHTILLSTSLARKLAVDDPRLLVRTEPGYPAPLAVAIPSAVSPGDPGAVKIETVADLRSLQTGVSTDLGTLIGISSWILLALASLSAATAMYLSVQARASEIALRRAIGASRFSIWRIFTLEGWVIGTAGGVIGGTVGLCAVIAICAAQGWTPSLDLGVLGLGALAGSVTGILSAAYPALVAARADPAVAIRR